MKLSAKLLLSFGLCVVIIIYNSLMAYNAANKFERQHNVAIKAEELYNVFAHIKQQVSDTVATMDTAHLDAVKQEEQKAAKLIQELGGLVTLDSSKERLARMQSTYAKNSSLIGKMHENFAKIATIDQGLTRLGDSIGAKLKDIEAELDKYYQETGDIKEQVAATYFLSTLPTIRLYITDVFMTYSNDAKNNINALMASADPEIKEYLQSHASSSSPLVPLIKDINEYVEIAKPFLGLLWDNHDISQQINQNIIEVMNESSGLTKVAFDTFNTVKENIVTNLLITTFVSALIGIALTMFLRGNVMKQLGADPSDLAALAKKVSDGNYDIDDGQKHVGVLDEFIIMVNKMKEALNYTQNILASFPVATAVFGSDNRLKYPTRK